MPTAPEMGTMAAAGRMPSMEAEPKTLTFEQLKFAREAALYVVSTKTTEEAIRIFTEGLKPVQGFRRPQQLMSSDDDDDDSSEDSTPRGGAGAGGTGCRRRQGSPRCCSIKRDDIATAPF